MNIQMENSKMRSEPSEHMWKTRVILTHLESYFGHYAQEVWERNRMDPDMRNVLYTKFLNAMLLNMYNPRLMKTILKKLREQFEKDDQMKTAGEITDLVPGTSFDWESTLGMTFRKIYTEELVLIASPDRCKWGLAMLRKSQKRSMKHE